MSILKKYWLFFIFLIFTISLLTFVFIDSEFVMKINKNTGLYLFSALIQSNAARISIFSIFYIFRLQTLNSSISNIFNNLCIINAPIADAARKFQNFSLEEKENKIENYKGDKEIGNEYIRWYNYEKFLAEIKTLMIKPTIVILTLISIQIVFLIFSNSIHVFGNVVEIACFTLIAAFQFYVFILLGKTINKMVQ